MNPTLRILFSEDDRDDQAFFMEALQFSSIKTNLTMVDNGKELMEALYIMEVVPDLIFLDINMPFKNGLECLMEIRHDERLRNIPVVVLSTTIQKKTVEITYELGANLYIAKPNNLEKLKQVVHEALKLDWTNAIRPEREHFFVNL